MTTREALYARLPALYRRRDAELGYPLRALLAVIDDQLEGVRASIETCWDNWFVETADESLVPYIGEMLAVPVTRDVPAIAFSRRAYVANTLRYRRAKGTAAMLELLARDLTNYPARAVEFFSALAWNESVNHRAERAATLDIRHTIELERLGTPFERATRSVDVRRIASGRGTHNLPNLGLFLWRTQVWPLMDADASPLPFAGQNAWRFNPLGRDVALYAALRTETDAAALAEEASVPLPLSRRRAWQEAQAAGPSHEWPFSLEVHGLDAASTPVIRSVLPQQIRICDLSSIASTPANPAALEVEVDPQIGRLALGSSFTTGLSRVRVVTRHFFATAGDLGAGPWDRDPEAHAWLSSWTGGAETRTPDFQVVVLAEGTGTDVVNTLDEAIRRWNDHLSALPNDTARSRSLGLILIGDSRTHAAPTRVISMPTGAVLGVFGATWPESPDPGGSPATVRLRGDLRATSVRPVVLGDLQVRGIATSATNRGELLVSGVALTGSVRVQAGALQGLRFVATTLLAGNSLLIDTSAGSNAALQIWFSRAVSGGVRADGGIGGVSVTDSAITGAVWLPEAALEVEGATFLETCDVKRLSASNSIFVELVRVEQHQDGCVRFCYVPAASRTPRRFRCQPDLAIEAAPPSDGALVELRVRPRFESTDPHVAGFLLLASHGSPEIAGAAEDGGEPGSWHHLQHGLRLANLRNALPQFLRFGLEPGIFFLV